MQTTDTTLAQTPELSEASNLINHTRQLVHHHREIERVTGAHFNLFEILGVAHYEVSTHSSLLADLLDPSGRHGQGSVFLKHFCGILPVPVPERFDVDYACVRTEVGVGPVTETSGGRMDIVITDKSGRRIAIENKIYAREQDNWVCRYRNSLHDDDYLIYLTLNGDEPSQASPEHKGKVVSISYAKNVLEWLLICRKEAATVPVVRETLTQYIQLIQTLTHQNTSSKMNTEIINTVLQSKDSFQAYCALHNAYSAIKRKIIRDLGDSIRSHPPAGCSVVSVPEGNGVKYENFRFSTRELDNLGLVACIEFDQANYGGCCYGFRIADIEQPLDESHPLRQKILSAVTSEYGPVESNDWWPAWKWWTPNVNWDDEVFQAIAFDSPQFENDLRAKVEDLISVTQRIVCPTPETN